VSIISLTLAHSKRQTALDLVDDMPTKLATASICGRARGAPWWAAT
jgi:hypothetical protein